VVERGSDFGGGMENDYLGLMGGEGWRWSVRNGDKGSDWGVEMIMKG
jgi:hypothetical protein